MALYASDPNAGKVRLKPNRDRIVEAILYLLAEAGRRGTHLTQYQIVKSLFVADTRHLNTHGRPVTFDNYVAMENGPVASEAYDMLKPDFNWSAVGWDSAPWTRRPSPADGPRAFRYSPQREPNLRRLSQTDLEALGEGLTLVSSLRFGGVKDFTHRHKAYQNAWKDNGGRVFDMDYALLLDTPDPELIDELVDVSQSS